MTVVREPAPAKLNLFLRVLGRRDDGYHEIETLILPLTLADGVEAAAADGLSAAAAGPYAAGVPTGEGNLVIRSARALAEACGVEPRARLLIAKNIPVAAGLGGGSTDAAAALRALNEVWGCGLSVEELAEVGAAVGSDVPALVHGRGVLARGRGERVERFDCPRLWWVVMPREGVGAAEAYARWDKAGATGPDPGELLDAVAAGDLDAIAGGMFNDLEAGADTAVEEAKRTLLDAGALAALMCGSGPSVAGLCRDGAHAEEVASSLEGVTGIPVASVSGRGKAR